jgi:hypothetical protein
MIWEPIDMPRFQVFSRSILICATDLELGDPPMGVAFGRFIPLPNYVGLQAAVIAARQTDQRFLGLTVRLISGESVDAIGVAILDASPELGPSEIEVTAVGISYPSYEELFPDHVAAYFAHLADNSGA